MVLPFFSYCFVLLVFSDVVLILHQQCGTSETTVVTFVMVLSTVLFAHRLHSPTFISLELKSKPFLLLPTYYCLSPKAYLFLTLETDAFKCGSGHM
jgi:hypothetical protein